MRFKKNWKKKRLLDSVNSKMLTWVIFFWVRSPQKTLSCEKVKSAKFSNDNMFVCLVIKVHINEKSHFLCLSRFHSKEVLKYTAGGEGPLCDVTKGTRHPFGIFTSLTSCFFHHVRLLCSCFIMLPCKNNNNTVLAAGHKEAERSNHAAQHWKKKYADSVSNMGQTWSCGEYLPVQAKEPGTRQ